MTCRCQEHKTNLLSRHVFVTRRQYAKGTGNKRGRHRRTVEGAVAFFIPGRCSSQFTSAWINGRDITILSRTCQRPPFGKTGLIEIVLDFVRIRGIGCVYLPYTGNSNPLRFSFRMEVGIQSAMIRIGAVIVATREDLNNILSLNSIPRCINRRLPITVHLFEKHCCPKQWLGGGMPPEYRLCCPWNHPEENSSCCAGALMRIMA